MGDKHHEMESLARQVQGNVLKEFPELDKLNKMLHSESGDVDICHPREVVEGVMHAPLLTLGYLENVRRDGLRGDPFQPR